MWYNLSNTSEPSKFPQENSTDSYLWYDGGKLPQGFILQQNFKQTPNRNVLAPQLQVQYFNWGNPTRPRDYPITHASYMGLVNGQMPYTPYPRQPLPNAGKSVIITKFNNVRQDNEFLADEIEEQKQWNSLLVQCITDVQKELDTVQQTAANLYNECQSLDETYERFSKQLDEEKRKLSETATKKRRRISEIKEVDAELAATLREEKDRSVLEIARLRDDVIDADIDVDSLTIKFQYELGKMITFPFWRLEEEIDEVISRWSGKSCVEESSKERAANTVGGHFYQERLASGSNKSSGRNKSDDCLEGRSAENSAEESEMSSRESSPSDEISVTSQLTAIKVKNSAEHSLSVVKSLSISESVSSQSNPPSAKDGCVETDFEFVEDLSFAHNDKAPTKLGKKIRKSSRFSRWLRSPCCIPRRNKDQ